jgi:hypothetical protein
MAQTMRHPLRGGLTAISGLVALVGTLAFVDARVRDQLAALFTSRGPTDEVRAFGEQLETLGLIVVEAVRDQSLDHAPMVIFAIAALVLVLFMTRT